MIDHSRRCIFVHIPKTAGNSIYSAFGTGWHNHKDLAGYALELPPATFQSYCKFAIVRNPWDRMLSEYNFQRKKSRPAAAKLFLFNAKGEIRSFREWIEAVFADPFRYRPEQWGGNVSAGTHRWSPQVDWLSLDGKIAVDRVLRLENLADEFAALSRALGLVVSRLPCRNRKFHWHYSRYYDEATRDLVAKYYARDIAAFDYRFESRRGSLLWFLAPRIRAALPVPATTT